ncbi:putative bifunctional diguanylate cyclase/phosphodiesterase [Nitrosococcus oceani]|uniref:Diguanylate cyclase/phosphodiesterase n=2 Tax=Nitrosococcus oceani TaxID=1229 RepID=Q3JE71_NITOC|nr:bifunctional diguanylate cyclase/phosphodiesterase [Nitrosococcus oceani]KFI20658.1 diguanylate phosphodiesterase [Nitrosococcus oceani C-27]ABA56875.1 diguanylate cyclase/phosphodiesterase [Nitrosococcus oceani ATCC 19707]EDZ65598.1 cyclic diguanylate phosphodiesterase domain protein [Nitrosococcus oceani AFC27]KFI23750.1 diguanylate phosphodiesterase [Nitrosococcus oceani]GEM21459.1 GGDEF-domain containing protein [Nitrosococcus oceani]
MPLSALPLPQRDVILAKLHQHLQSPHSQLVGLLIIKLCHFREINTAFGYQAGDALLIQFAEHICGHMRPQDELARIGDAEFSLILPSLHTGGQALLAANRVWELAQQYPFTVNGHTPLPHIAMGIALCPEHEKEPELLLRAADLAVAEAQKTGNPYHIYHSQMLATATADLVLEEELEHALENDEFRLFFQPKISFSTNRITGTEALIRWQHPTQGMIPPGKFIPLIEKSALMEPVTLWVLNTALRYRAEWAKKGIPLSVAVNFPPTLLINPEIAELIRQATRIWGTGQGDLILEVTESAVMTDPKRSLETLRHLAALGIELSIDDFGTGYSSLAYLKNMPVNELKIDKSFVDEMAANQGDSLIVQAVTDLGHNFNLRVTAEGIEDQATLEGLREIGCDYGQGYFLGRPMAPQDLENWIKESPWGMAIETATA